MPSSRAEREITEPTSSKSGETDLWSTPTEDNSSPANNKERRYSDAGIVLGDYSIDSPLQSEDTTEESPQRTQDDLEWLRNKYLRLLTRTAPGEDISLVLEHGCPPSLQEKKAPMQDHTSSEDADQSLLSSRRMLLATPSKRRSRARYSSSEGRHSRTSTDRDRSVSTSSSFRGRQGGTAGSRASSKIVHPARRRMSTRTTSISSSSADGSRTSKPD